MSYDLMVFEPTGVHRDHGRFMDWYEHQVEWAEEHGYNDPTVATAKLRAWFADIIQSFPPLNGPLSKEELPEDEASATDYSVGKTAIYCGFAWSKAEQAYTISFKLAERHDLGFFDVSSGGEEVWLPSDGRLILAHSM